MNSDLQHANPLCRTPGAGARLEVLGVTHIYKATAAETGNRFSLWEAVVPPGAGAPPHSHSHEDESFYVLSGEVLIEVESEARPLRVGPGGFFFGPRNQRHAFRNLGETEARLLVLSTPGAGLDRMFAAIDAATKNAAGMPAVETLAAIARQYGVAIHPPAADAAREN